MSFSIFFVIFIKVATGMSEHDNYGVEFLKATTRIKALCKGPTF
jgi:cobalamin-dependent methionine synthase I